MQKQIIVPVLWTLFSLSMLRCKKPADPAITIFRVYDSLQVDGYQRTYLLNLPPDYNNNTPLPLVIALHGTAGSALQMERDYKLTTKSNNAGFIVVYPEGVPSNGRLGVRTWNAGSCCDFAMEQNINDVKFIRQLIEKVAVTYKIDPKKIYATGMSNGAMMVYRLGCELSDRLAAIAPVSGTLMTTQACTPGRAVPVMHIHSVQDTKIPYAGGYGLANYYFHPVDSALHVWATIDGCNPEPLVITNAPLYTHTQYVDCRNNTTVQLYLTKDGGHSWPGGLQARPAADEPSAAFDATDLIWGFFQQNTLP
jgi:polyhydroxybutyrate depolymerase